MKTIFKSCKDTHFVKIANSMLRDKRLSMGARGLLAMILTHSEEWIVTKLWLIDQGPDGYDAITSMLKELQAAGYAANEKQGRDESGAFTRSVWIFSDEEISGNRSGLTAHGNPGPANRVPPIGSRQPHTKKEQSSEENGTEENGEGFVGEGSPTPQPPQGPNGSTLEANPEAEPTGSGRETPPVPRPPLADKYADARKVLAHLNAATSSRYRDTTGNLTLIHGRLQEVNGDVGGVLQMIDRMAAKWLKDPKMVDYLCPSTLFRKSNFGGYYDNRDKPVVPLMPRAPLMPRTKEPWQVRRDTKEELERIEKALRVHPGYGQSDVFIPDWCTPELEADAAKLVARRKELKAILASLPSET